MAMPTYAMSCFKLSRKLCKDITTSMASNWWGETDGKIKMHWLSWKKIALKRSEGGLGFKDIEAFKKALLGKQIWRILTKPNLLVSKVLRAKYFPKDSIFKRKPQKNASWIWQGLLGARSLIKKGVIRRTGNGRSTNIWEHQWIPGSSSGREDSYFWQHNAGGFYSVSSRYKLLIEESRSIEKVKSGEAGPSIMEGSQQLKQMWNTLWKLNIKHKIKLFIWKCIKGMGDPVCRACGESQETVEHLLLSCPKTLDIWKVAPIQWDGARDQHRDFKRWWSKISEAKTRPEGAQHIGLTANILWQV
ncbi:uncharacterized protein [Coffea arabica]|uniref:Reverse transcriptase zinc-binding domain-containing protein n=1 Tax=Coffea arabica TaxID=13443 RepID=A0ABM4VQL4_COFAR